MTNWSLVEEKVRRSERLSFDEGVELYHSNNIVALGRPANQTRERLNGNKLQQLFHTTISFEEMKRRYTG